MHTNTLNENQRIKEMLIEKDSVLSNLGYERHQLQDRMIKNQHTITQLERMLKALDAYRETQGPAVGGSGGGSGTAASMARPADEAPAGAQAPGIAQGPRAAAPTAGARELQPSQAASRRARAPPSAADSSPDKSPAARSPTARSPARHGTAAADKPPAMLQRHKSTLHQKTKHFGRPAISEQTQSFEAGAHSSARPKDSSAAPNFHHSAKQTEVCIGHCGQKKGVLDTKFKRRLWDASFTDC
jgi:hypothetical protein